MLKPFLKKATQISIILVLLFGLGVQAKPALAIDPVLVEIVVNHAGDDPDAGATTNMCETANGNNECTLRAAIQTANSSQSTQGTLITFHIDRGTIIGPTVIDINSALPSLQVANTTIQGPNLSDGSAIVLDGQKGAYRGFVIRANDCAIKNLTICDFGGFGIVVVGTEETPVTGTLITGNKIGDLNPFSVFVDEPNFGGIRLGLYTGSAVIGGNAPNKRNIISGNTWYGIYLEGDGTNVIQGNYIGVKENGTQALPNDWGIFITGSSQNTVGGITAGERNIISGNKNYGIIIEANDNYVTGNYIGMDITGTIAIPNGADGVRIGISPTVYSGNQIGGIIPGLGNLISGNLGKGIELDSAVARVEGNSIYNNAGLGIDVFRRPDQRGVTPNDASEADNIQNFPVLTSVSFPNAGKVLLQGQMTTTPNEELYLYFYGNDACDSSGYGEGQVFLGYESKIADASGRISFAVELPNPESKLTFTATAWGGKHGNSEFSLCMPISIYLPLIMK